MVDLADVGCALVVLAAPIFCVWRFNRRGILIGAGVSWLVGVLIDLIAIEPDPEAGPIKHLWLRYGWAATLSYATLIYFAKWGYRKTRAPIAMPPVP